MTLFVCFRKPGTIGRFLYQQTRMIVIPTSKTNGLSNAPLFKNYLRGSKNTSIYDNVKSFGTSIIRRQEEKPHDHHKLWIVEKGTTAAMVVLIPLGLLIPNKLFDTILAILITAHSHWGLEACVVEYVRVLLFGPQLPKICMGIVYGISIFMLGGLMFLNFNDIGLCRGFWRIWRNMRKPAGGGSSKIC